MKFRAFIIMSIIAALLFPYSSLAAAKSAKVPVVVIDAGHGGGDYGAVKGGITEKSLNLDIAKRLSSLLKDNKVKVYMTRTTDRAVDLYSRSDLANSVNADFFISIHNNSGSSGDKGTMTLYYPGNAKTSRGLDGRDIASIFQRQLTSVLGTVNQGLISRPNLAVLRTTNMPAVIAEVGYMSNKSDLAKLKTSSYRQKAAMALEKAILKALGSR